MGALILGEGDEDVRVEGFRAWLRSSLNPVLGFRDSKDQRLRLRDSGFRNSEF